ncbi:adhesion G protein-coupled receptor L2-like isoform X3 [Acanthaster planci]|uniref:Adhesion G protein-coupled receptor L2-like isoform X3 n=1 Tax=Acanthaster planci TaxID=133434 RepID=A0A8B7YUX6_ACAPL|nr:adhesion G protein-coupled receptor L2-like isoform X3 [Acanthaster planci]
MAVRPEAGRILMFGRVVCWMLVLLLAAENEAEGITVLERVRRQEVLYSSVCEGSTMNLRCLSSEHILIIESANFGRTDTDTCPRGPNNDTECIQPSSFEIVAERCSNKKHCAVPATNQIFGNPCPDIYKYLEVQFQCIMPPPTTRPSTTTTIPPPTVAVSTPSPTVRPTQRPTQMSTQRPTQMPTQSPTQSPTQIPTQISTQSPTQSSTQMVTTSKVAAPTSKPVPPLTSLALCPATFRRGIQWPQILSGSLSRQPCPEGTVGRGAEWHCEGRPAMWIPESGPDLSRCVSEWAEDIEDKLDVSASEISEVIASAVENNKKIYGGDLVVVTDLMMDSVGKLKEELAGLNNTQKFEMAETVTKNYVKIGSTVLGGSKLESWQDLPGAKKTKTATSLLSSIEETGFVLAENLGTRNTLTSEEGNVVLNVVVQDASKGDLKDISFPRPSQLTSSEWQDITDSISIPEASLKDRSKDGLSKVVFLAYNNLGSLLESSSFGNDQEQDLYVVNSRILSASIGDPRASSDLSQPATIIFEHINANFSKPVCSFWKFMNSTGSSVHADSITGEWSDTGCTMTGTNATHTTCSCTHLTNFAILMNTKGTPIPHGDAFALSIITYIGFIVSCICLLLAFITFAYFQNLQNDRNTIHKNLCICLFIAEIVFMAGIDQASRGAMCTVVALFLHYFFLAAFAWMCLEGIQLYVMLVEVFEAESSRRKYYYPFGYGLPLLVVGIAAAIDIGSYGTEEYCWLAVDNNFIWAFVAPVIVIIVVNTMFLSMAIFIMCRHSTMQTSQKEKTKKEKITPVINEQNFGSSQQIVAGDNNMDVAVSWVRGALVLLCLLGITWAFGLLYVTESLLVFAYIFTIANVFQGMFIFIFHCFMNEKVIKEYRRFIRNSMWMPEWIRDRYGGTFYTGSNQHRSSSSSSGKKRIWSQEDKRLSNTTGSSSADHRKLSTSSNGRNSGEFIPVRFTASVPETKDGHQRLSDEGIGLEMEDGQLELAQVAKGTPSPTPKRSREDRDLPASPAEVRPLLDSPREPPPSPEKRQPLPLYRQLSPPSYRPPKSGNFTSLPDLAQPPPAGGLSQPAKADKKGSLPELPRSPRFLRTKITRMNSDSQRAGHWSPLDEQKPPDEVDVADDNSGDVEFLGITSLSPRRETLI